MMAVPREMANTSLSPTDAEDDPVRPDKDAWKAAGITIELSKRAQEISNFRVGENIQDSNGKERDLQLRSTDTITLCRRLNDWTINAVKMSAHLFMVSQPADKETHSQDKEQI
jgi:hypothetical protein